MRREQGQGLTAERREPVGVVVGQADRGLTQRVTLPPAIAEQRADQRQPASSSVDQILDADANAQIVVAGDFNAPG